MPGNRKPRKKHRARRVVADTVSYVLKGFAPLDPAGVTRTLTCNHDALTSLTDGTGEQHHWRTVCEALNVALVLDEQVYAGAYKPELTAAIEAHAQCGVRRWQGKNYGYSGPELQSVFLAMEVHDTQMRQATVGEIERAFTETRRRELDVKRHYTVRQRAEAQEAL